MILKALLALSSAHKRRTLDPANRARGDLVPDAQETFMLNQYGGAMRDLQTHINDGEKSSESRLLLAILTCALFVILEGNRGRYDAAYVHITSGARLIQQLVGSFGEGAVDAHKLHFFARVKDQMKIFLQLRRPSTHTSTPGDTFPTLRFKSPVDAGHLLNALIEESAHVVEETQLASSSAVGLRALLSDEHAYYIASFETWHLAFEATISEKAVKISSPEMEEWNNLQQRYHMARQFAVNGLRFDPENEKTESRLSISSKRHAGHSRMFVGCYRSVGLISPI
jgi:hypothetical protein